MSPLGIIRNSWPWARVNLGLTKAEFGALTPAEWDAMLEVWMERERARVERENRLVARLCLAVNLTIPRSPGSQVPTEDDFMPKVVNPDDEGGPDDESLKQAFLMATARRQSVTNTTS